jgi:type VI secretion system protein ImpG
MAGKVEASLMDPRLLRLYESELAFMRDMGTEFADEFPKIAGRLNLASIEVTDPYVERLLEGFAFLTARVQLKMEAEFPTFTQSLLQMVYPHYMAPTPSMAVVQIRPDNDLRSMPEGARIPRGTDLRSLLGTEDQTNCVFRTAHDVHLLPVEMPQADYVASPAAVAALGLPEQRGVKAAIRIRLKTPPGMPFNTVLLEKLAFFMSGPETARPRLYEQLLGNVAAIYVRPTTRPLPWQEKLPTSALRGMGFDDDEALLPRAPQSFDGYRLLQEYYAMPERFLFVELDGLDRAAIRCDSNELEIIFLLTRSEPALATGFGPDHMALHCTPAINLFPRRSDRINLAERDLEHQIVPDRMRPLDYEVFSVEAVEGYAPDGSPPIPFLPFYAASDLSRNPDHRSYYMLRRQPRLLSARARQRGPRSSYIGHDTFISLVDPDANQAVTSLRQLGLDLLCTNRDLPLAMPVGKQHTDFTLALSAPVASIRCLVGPTAPRPCRGDGDYAWRFISHLGLNYLSLVDTDALQGAAALRALLRLYVPSSASLAARQLEGLLSVACRPVTRRIAGVGPAAVGRGLELTLTIDEAPFGGAGGILMAAVLDRFFAKYVSINAFTETIMRSQERGEVMRWPMRLGLAPVL